MNTYEILFEKFINDFSKNLLVASECQWVAEIDISKILSKVGESEGEHFWLQHSENIDRYKEIVLNFNIAQNKIKQQGNLLHLPLSSPILQAYDIFKKYEPIKLLCFENYYLLDGNGRHRIEAAKALKNEGVDVKLGALVTNYASKNIPNINQPKTQINGMARQIENQIELLQDANRLFKEHSEKLTELSDLFTKKVISLEQENLNHDYMDFIQEFLSDYIVKLKTMREVIDEEYVPEINRKIQHLEDR